MLPTITTPADGCLAVAVQIYSDNSDEAAGAILNGGATGGTWTKAGERLGVTGGPGNGLAVFVAEIRPPADLRRQRQPEPDQLGELGQPDVRVLRPG